jgi:HSP20 family molecular chaperone IbpA
MRWTSACNVPTAGIDNHDDNFRGEGAVSTHHKPDDRRPRVTLPLGLDGLFRGITHVLQTASHIADTVPEDPSGAVDVTQTGTIGPKGMRAVYGASVHIGPRVAPLRGYASVAKRRARRTATEEDAREPMADVHDEGDHYLIVAELPGAAETSVQWSVRDGRRLVVRADCQGRKYYTELTLAETVDEDTIVSCYANGVLELRLWKRLRD